jgi:hypothetical protein
MKTLWKTYHQNGDAYKTATIRYDGGHTVLFSVGKEAIALSRSEIADIVQTLRLIYPKVAQADIQRIAQKEAEYRKKREQEQQKVQAQEVHTLDLTSEVIA